MSRCVRGGWVWWAPAEAAPHKVVTEYWGAGRFVGIYPIRDKIGVIAAGPVDEIGHAKIGGSGRKLAERFATMVAPLTVWAQTLRAWPSCRPTCTAAPSPCCAR